MTIKSTLNLEIKLRWKNCQSCGHNIGPWIEVTKLHRLIDGELSEGSLHAEDVGVGFL
jgi:hypothetical protein